LQYKRCEGVEGEREMKDLYDVYVKYSRTDVIEVEADTMDEAEAKALEIAEARLRDDEEVVVEGFNVQL
jgi:hypothetical protein